MTAAFAEDEYEVPPDSAAPAEAVERVKQGNVVYLTWHGERFAAMVPPSSADVQKWADALSRVQEIADNPERSAGLRAWAHSQLAQILEIIGVIEEEEEERQDVADAEAALAEGDPIAAEQLWAELGV